MCNPILTLDEAQSLAAKLAKNTHEPAHVVRDGMLLRIASDADVACWQLRDVVWSVEPEQVYDLDDATITSIITTMVRSGLNADPPPDDAPGDDCPDHGPYGDDDCPKCLNCTKPHHTWQCPEIHALLRAEPVVMVRHRLWPDTDFAPAGWPA